MILLVFQIYDFSFKQWNWIPKFPQCFLGFFFFPLPALASVKAWLGEVIFKDILEKDKAVNICALIIFFSLTQNTISCKLCFPFHYGGQEAPSHVYE